MIKKITISQLDKEYLLKDQNRKAGSPDQKVDFTKFVVNKPWGCEYLVFSNPQIEIWHLFIKKLASTSVHCHPNKKTGLILLEGEAILSTLNESFKLNPLDAVVMDAGIFHSTQAISEGGIHLLETETPPDKYDLVRLQDKYGRIKCGYEGREAMFPDRENSLRFLNIMADNFIEKDFYNKRISVQNVKASGDEMHPHIKNSELAVVLSNKISDESGQSSFSVGDIVRGDEFVEKLRTRQLNDMEKELIIMSIKTAL